jgi:hypothetical protein
VFGVKTPVLWLIVKTEISLLLWFAVYRNLPPGSIPGNPNPEGVPAGAYGELLSAVRAPVTGLIENPSTLFQV